METVLTESQVLSSLDIDYCESVATCRKMSSMDTQRQEAADDLDYAIGDRVNTLMRRRGYTRKSMGVVFGLGESAMSLKLNGKRTWSAFDVRLAADELNVTVAVLYGDEPMPEPTRPARITSIDTTKNAGNQRTTDYGYEDSVVHVDFGRRAVVS